MIAHTYIIHPTWLDETEQGPITLESLRSLYQTTHDKQVDNVTIYFAWLLTLDDFGVEPESSGSYVCKADNGLTTSKNTIQITVNGIQKTFWYHFVY